MELETDSKRDGNSTDRRLDDRIRALKRERAFYAAQGKPDRVEAVDKELERMGAEPEPIERAVTTAPEHAEPSKARSPRKPSSRKAKA